MPSGIPSSCINHPSIEAVGRCKQCGKPFCGSCRIQGPTGYFCAEECKVAHEKFTERAQQLDSMKKGGAAAKLVTLLRKVVVWGIVILAAAGVATYFGINIPYLSDLFRNVLGG